MKLLKLLFCLAVFALAAGAQSARSLCFFFDFNSMSAAEQLRAQQAAISFSQKNLTPTDMVAVVTFTSEVKVVQQFSADHDALIATLGRIVPSAAGSGNANTLVAIEDVAKRLEIVAGKKQLIYFSAGLARTGFGNQDQLHAAINAASRANVSIYPIDTNSR